jgi:Calcineurin-like phosphoesterase
MPDPERLLRTLHQAIRAFRKTRGRRGRLVDLTSATDVLVVGDLHGNLANFSSVLRKADLAGKPGRHLVLQELIHGPQRYPAGGDKSHQLVDLVAALKCQYPERVHFLLGNHEQAQATGQAIAKVDWDLNALFREGVDTAYGGHAAAIYGAYLELFAAIPLALRTSNGVFVSHSLPSGKRLPAFNRALLEKDRYDELESQPGGPVHALLWGRDVRAPIAAGFLEKVGADLLVTGHIPCTEGFAVPNDRQIILDAQGTPGCYCLFPADRPLTHAELVACVGTL